MESNSGPDGLNQLLSLTEWMKTWFLPSRINLKTCDAIFQTFQECFQTYMTVVAMLDKSNEIFSAILLSNCLSGKPLWRVNTGCSLWWSEICQMFNRTLVGVIHQLSGRQSDLEEASPVEWLSDFILCELSTCKSKLYWSHPHISWDFITWTHHSLFNFILFLLFPQVETQLSLDECVREGVVKQQADLHQA